MGFQERIDAQRQARADAARAETERDEREREARRTAARAEAMELLPQVHEAIDALRRDSERSAALLMRGQEPGVRRNWGLGAMTETVYDRDARRWYRTADQHRRSVFGATNPKGPLEALADGALYGHSSEGTSEGGPRVEHESTAADAFRNLLAEIESHLLQW